MTHCDHKQEEHDATRRLTQATYLLVIATIALVLVTAMLALRTEHETRPIETTEVRQ